MTVSINEIGDDGFLVEWHEGNRTRKLYFADYASARRFAEYLAPHRPPTTGDNDQ